MSLPKAPVVVAHRGSRYLWPENTMVAFEGAVAAGATHIETDLRMTSDGVVMCLHDAMVDRTTNGSGPVAAKTYRELSNLDAGYGHRGLDGYTHRDTGVRVPSLSELASCFPDVELVLDIKSASVLPGLLGVFAAHDLYDRTVVGSFRDRWLDDLHRMSGGRIRTSTGTRRTRDWIIASRSGRRPASTASFLAVPTHFRGVTVVDDRLVSSARSHGVPVYVWTVNRPEEMRRLAGIGVEGLITDRPDLAVAVAAEEMAG